MAVARKSDVSARETWLQTNSPAPLRQRHRSTRIEARLRNAATPSVEVLPAVSHVGTMPSWLLRLIAVNRYSSVAAFLFVVATLAIYGWTVYYQELWSQTYRRLQRLERYERQLITTNATLTSKMADEAESPATGLVAPSTEGTIFLLPATQRTKHLISHKTPQPETPAAKFYPLGY
jgi:hypothetical protein